MLHTFGLWHALAWRVGVGGDAARCEDRCSLHGSDSQGVKRVTRLGVLVSEFELYMKTQKRRTRV